QLFDLQDDPQELHNVAQYHQHLRETARQELLRHLRAENVAAYTDNGALLELPFQAEFQEVVLEPNRTAAHTVEAERR
ncbi:MAG: hypothetical protein M3439_03240, partial [Chloroflexota bacterium]|nr:hypothetical protein [Chloroflexota bacterium]